MILDTWDSGLHIITGSANYTVCVPATIAAVVKAIDEQVTTEFSVFCKINSVQNSRIYLSEEYFIPEQEVTSCSVEYKESAPAGFDVVIHKHPSTLKEFSATDEEYINSNFSLSILYCQEQFVLASLKTIYNGLLFQLKTNNIEIVFPETDVDISKIKEKAPVLPIIAEQPIYSRSYLKRRWRDDSIRRGWDRA